jgi:hypothetical protein
MAIHIVLPNSYTVGQAHIVYQSLTGYILQYTVMWKTLFCRSQVPNCLGQNLRIYTFYDVLHRIKATQGKPVLEVKFVAIK